MRKLLIINATAFFLILISIWVERILPDTTLEKYFANKTLYLENSANQSDLMMLTKLIQSESGTENFLDKLMVGSVVLNWMRKKDMKMKDIIYHPNKFSGVYGKGFRYNIESERAAKILLQYGPIDSTVFFFINPKIATDRAWALTLQERELVLKNTNHYFYR